MDRAWTWNTEGTSLTLDLPRHGTQGSSYSYSEAAMSPYDSLSPPSPSLRHVKRMKEKFENKTDESKQETACGHSEDRAWTYNTRLPRSTLDLPGHGTQGSSYSYSEAAMSPHASLLPPITSLTKNETNEAKNEMNKAEQHEQEIRELKKKFDELEKKIAIQRAQEKQEFKRQLEELEEKIEKYKETAKKELSEEELEKKLEEFIKTIAKNEPSKGEIKKKFDELEKKIGKIIDISLVLIQLKTSGLL
ncbi:uncharacterized protein [Saccopteryx bilineata]|uniref:uncharacterized protein n=1 Tax=Saccopteryx bilineata TaxID=59482 RepID=UPI00338DB67A